MYRIYFNQRCLAVCSLKHKDLQEPDAVIYSPEVFPNLPQLPELPDLLELFEESPHISKLYVPVPDNKLAFAQVTSKLSHIAAGGGIVTNINGDYLIIFHHGVWDFPKGMQEDNEDIQHTALREVEEECGVHDLEIKEYLCDTYHTYHRDGEFILKTTHWYRMEYKGNGFETCPQAEEEIERAIWVSEHELPTYLDTSYPSIQYLYKFVTGKI